MRHRTPHFLLPSFPRDNAESIFLMPLQKQTQISGPDTEKIPLG